MKTFEAFMEATEGDLKAMGASPSQIALLKKRQENRGKGFNSGDDRPEKGGPLAKRPITRAVPTRGGALAKRDSSALTKPADKGTAIVKAKQNKASASKPVTPKGGEGFGRKVPGGWGKTFGKDDDKFNKKKKTKDRFAGAKSWLKDNIKDDSKEIGSSQGKVSGPQMGIYNPK